MWQGRPEGDVADAAAFTGPYEVGTTVPRWGGQVCTYRTGINPLTLEPDRLQDDRNPGRTGC